MDGASGQNDWIDISSDDELEDYHVPVKKSSVPSNSPQESIGSSLEENALSNLLQWTSPSSSTSSRYKLIHHFVGMGFSEKKVIKSIADNGDNEEAILEALLSFSVVKDITSDASTEPCSEKRYSPDSFSSEYSSPLSKESTPYTWEKDEALSMLVDMGYPVEEAVKAIDTCGLDAQVCELTDFICAAQLEKEIDSYPPDLPNQQEVETFYTRQQTRDRYPIKRKRASTIVPREDDYQTMHLPNPMIGFGVPDYSCHMVARKLPETVAGPPYFYYENVALTPKGVWPKISRFLYEVEPEFVDSQYFCAAARKRGYIHNLPINNRYPLKPVLPLTIQTAVPSTRDWWAFWDKRTQLNCLQTSIASAKLTEKIRKMVGKYGDEPPPDIQKYILGECKKWNLVWVGKNKVAPLEPDEYEMLLGFPRDHTRGGGISRTDRYKSLGNAFQVDTVAYHLSVLKNLYPNGMRVLSLFSGIGGAEVALHRLEIPLNIVVSVEIAEVNRNIIRSWWEQTNQKGKLVEVADVQAVTADKVEKWVHSFGGFDLIIGGSPCNNLAGRNRVSRDGLEGEHSSLFYEYFRILDLVKVLMGRY